MITAKYFLRITKGNEVLYESSDLGDTFTANSENLNDLALGLAQAINGTNAANFIKAQCSNVVKDLVTVINNTNGLAGIKAKVINEPT